MSSPVQPNQRRRAVLLAVGYFSPLLLLPGGFVALAFGASWLGLFLIVASAVLRTVTARLVRRYLREVGGPPGERWWYNRHTGEVEEGRGVFDPSFDGPYASREDALRAPEIARERAERWNAED